MNRILRFCIAVSISTMFLMVFACATVPPEVKVEQHSAFAKTGDTVHLFHGGSAVAKEEFCPNAVVPVYRYEGRYSTVGSTPVKRQEVGKIRITKNVGDYYAEGVVVEGTIKNGDVAVQPRTGCLVNLP